MLREVEISRKFFNLPFVQPSLFGFRQQKFSQTGQIIGVDQIDACVQQALPNLDTIGGSPETDLAALFMCLGDDLPKLLFFGSGKETFTTPLEVRLPILA